MSIDQAPRQALGPDNQQWRQWVERSVLSISKRLEEKFGPDVANSFKATASSLGLLSKQVVELQVQQAALALQQTALEGAVAAIASQQAYLASLVTYTIQTGTVSSTDTSGSIITSGTSAPSLTFSLPQPLKVRVTLRASASLSVSGNSASTFTNGSIFSAIGMDGAVYSGGRGTAYISTQPGSGANHSAATTTDIVSQVIVDLAAGTHTAYSEWRFQANAVSANLRVLNPVLTVDVIGLP